jgi:hypothetical protein
MIPLSISKSEMIPFFPPKYLMEKIRIGIFTAPERTERYFRKWLYVYRSSRTEFPRSSSFREESLDKE